MELLVKLFPRAILGQVTLFESGDTELAALLAVEVDRDGNELVLVVIVDETSVVPGRLFWEPLNSFEADIPLKFVDAQ